MKSLKPKMDMAFAASGLDLGIDILGLSSADSRLLSQSGDSVMTEDVVDRLPQVQYREPIPYPESAKEKNLTGHVTLNLLINKEGEVDQVKLLDSQPEGIFDQAAMQAVKSWSFSPAEYKGQFVSVWVKQKLKFQV
ncbi:MAG: energy transducer TonB, partial [Pseudomonadota bacterium]